LLSGSEIRAERNAVVDTIDSLSDTEFNSAPTLCTEWAPRDVLAHLIGTGRVGQCLRTPWRVHSTNASVVAISRDSSRAGLIAAGRAWADIAGKLNRVIASALIGDVAMHHQDVLRGLGRVRDLPSGIESALFLEGIMLSVQSRHPRLLRYRVVPTNGAGTAVGRGAEVRGTSEALGMWLGGRAVEHDLEFTSIREFS
jgi:uncharacterized protein (TIGR03083 family)